MVVAGKAAIEEAVENKFIRSQHGQFAWPKIVRLLQYVKVPYAYGEVPFSKAGVLKRDDYICAYCSKKADTIDHIIPQSVEPSLSRDWMNVVSACFPCNNKKAARTPKEAHMVLLYEPTTPYQLRRLRGGK